MPTADPRLAYLTDIADLEPGKSVDVEDGIWAGRTEADAEVRRSLERASYS